jgi:hypothetical protein
MKTSRPARAWGWDEHDIPFFEYAERSNHQASKYLSQLSQEQGVDVRPRLSLVWTFLLAGERPGRWALAGGGVILAAIAGFLWAQSFSILLAFAFLAGAAGLDLIVYLVRPLRTICYRCLAIYRGARPNPKHGPYDLGTAARFADDFEERRRMGGS